jgi:hypothetical protein
MNELMAFNIRVSTVDIQTFFGIPNLPQTTVSPVILNNLEEPIGGPGPPLLKSELDFFSYLEDAMAIPPAEESFVDDFAAFILRLMNYNDGRRLIHLWKALGFEMCGQRVDAKTDVCITERSPTTGVRYLLLVQEDKVRKPHLCMLQTCSADMQVDATYSKRHMSREDPEQQLIAEVIAAFYENNKALRAAGLPTLQSKTFVGITMVGSAPIFYKIPVTEELLTCLATSQYPPHPTIVQKFFPPVPNLSKLSNDGMRPLVNRCIIFRCFEAFKPFVVSY